MSAIYSYGPILFISVFVSVVSMPFLVILSKQLGAISEVGGRHVGEKAVGRLGGVGALVGCLSGISFEMYFNPLALGVVLEMKRQMIGAGLSLALLALVGFWDDVRRLTARFKFFVQIFAALVSYFSGLGIFSVDLPFIAPIELGLFSLPMTVLWIIGIVNAVNLIDGLDGLAGGVILFGALVNLVTALCYGSWLTGILMASVIGSILGFLFFNWYPAKIYLGDGGAYSFGFLLAICGFLAPVQKASTSVALLIPILSVGLAIVDTSVTMLRRFLKKRRIFTPDRGHLHHVLLDAGISHRRVVVGLYCVCCVLCSLAITIVLRRNKLIGVCFLVASVIGALYWGFTVRPQLKNIVQKNGKDDAAEPQ